METKVVDARGEQCPIPVVKATKALQEMGSGTLEVHVDNAVAVQNLQRMASGRGLQAAEQQLAPDHYVVTIPVGDGAAEAADGLRLRPAGLRRYHCGHRYERDGFRQRGAGRNAAQGLRLCR